MNTIASAQERPPRPAAPSPRERPPEPIAPTRYAPSRVAGSASARPRRVGGWWLWLTLAAAGAGAGDTLEAALERGDRAWQRRVAGHQGLRADPEPIAEAVAAYRDAVAADPESAAARERLLRALYFQGQFAAEAEARLAIHAQARDLAEAGLDRLALELGGRERLDGLDTEEIATALTDRPEAAMLFFWAAAHWGLWGEQTGRLAAARQGVARKVRDYALIAARVDETYEAGGGHRILGRLHTEAPRIPLVTGWVDRDLAVTFLERAVELAPDEPLNRLYLAEALLEFRPGRRAEALTLLEELAGSAPRPGRLLEDERLLRDARAALTLARAGRRGPG